MTDTEKAQVKRLKEEGRSYSEISKTTGISISALKMFFKRNQSIESDEEQCKQCGMRIATIPHHRKKQFCSDSCRFKYWESHHSRTSAHSCTCLSCGKEFNSTVPGRKFCSQECYFNNRFKGGADASKR